MTAKANKIIIEFFKELELTSKNLILFIASFLYFSGYLIQSTSLRNFGIYRIEIIKFQYIEVGFTFIVLILLVTLVPIGCYFAHFRIRKKSGLPHYWIGAIGYMINTYNLFTIIAFSAIFITWKEWSLMIDMFDLGFAIKYYKVFFAYLGYAMVILIGLPLIERKVVEKSNNVTNIYMFIIEPLRVFGVIIALLFDIFLIYTFPWIGDLLVTGLTFLGASISLVFIIFVIIYYMKKLGDGRNLHVLGAISSTGILVLLFFCINAYVFSVVRYIPMNRGGRLPITESYLVSNDSIYGKIKLESFIKDEVTGFGPVYIIEETQDFIFIVSPDSLSWFNDWASTCAIKKNTIKYINNNRISENGLR